MNIRIVIDCKDYKKPVDVKRVEEFYGMVRDVGAHQGSMVCPAGFSTSAKKRAKRLNIALYSLVGQQSTNGRPAACVSRRSAISEALQSVSVCNAVHRCHSF